MLAASAVEDWSWYAHKEYKSGVSCWFRFREPLPAIGEPSLSQRPLVDEFIHFLEQHVGLAARTRRAYSDVVHQYLRWQFGSAQSNWRRVKPKDIWDYAYFFGRGRAAGTLNHDLLRLRRFFRFLLMRGLCSADLASAVPRFANFGQTRQPGTLSDQQRRTLLGAFNLKTAVGTRDQCLVLCMVDLGLRPMEVARLTLGCVNWERKALLVPATKTEHGRELPLVARLVTALRTYVRAHRPTTACDRLFVRHDAKHIGSPLDSRAIGVAIRTAYHRCKFSDRWRGCYRLRHTFATRLHARGADLKQIADLLGHRHLQTTTIYAKVDPNGLRALALRWPLS